MALAVRLAYDNAMIERYGINAKSYMEIEIVGIAKGDVSLKAEGEAIVQEDMEEDDARKTAEANAKGGYSCGDACDWIGCHSPDTG